MTSDRVPIPSLPTATAAQPSHSALAGLDRIA
jgi:hypothetical protein